MIWSLATDELRAVITRPLTKARILREKVSFGGGSLGHSLLVWSLSKAKESQVPQTSSASLNVWNLLSLENTKTIENLDPSSDFFFDGKENFVTSKTGGTERIVEKADAKPTKIFARNW